jgi:hypothetical protein
MLQRTLNAAQVACDLQVPSSSAPYQMRSIDAAAGNRNVLSGRIHRSSAESQQHTTPSVRTFCFDHVDATSFMEHSYANFETMPPLTTAPSSVGSIWYSPPTPVDRELIAPILQRNWRSFSGNLKRWMIPYTTYLTNVGFTL